MPPIPIRPDQVEHLVQRWFPEQGVVISRMGSGSSTPVYQLVVDGATSYLRLAEEPGEDRLGEVVAHQQALAAGASVPGILRFEANPPDLDRSAALTSAMPGVPLADWGHPVPELTIAGIAADLERVHRVPVRGYGWIDGVGDDGRLVAQHPTRAAWVAEYAACLARIEAAGSFPPAMTSALGGRIEEWLGLPDRGESSLVHGDFDPSHLYVDPVTGCYQGMIDLGEIRGADPLYDLGHLVVHAFDPVAQDIARRLIDQVAAISAVDRHELRLQAIAIATRALGIQLTRPASAYSTNLRLRLATLLEQDC